VGVFLYQGKTRVFESIVVLLVLYELGVKPIYRLFCDCFSLLTFIMRATISTFTLEQN
jgi:hypothetical protein